MPHRDPSEVSLPLRGFECASAPGAITLEWMNPDHQKQCCGLPSSILRQRLGDRYNRRALNRRPLAGPGRWGDIAHLEAIRSAFPRGGCGREARPEDATPTSGSLTSGAGARLEITRSALQRERRPRISGGASSPAGIGGGSAQGRSPHAFSASGLRSDRRRLLIGLGVDVERHRSSTDRAAHSSRSSSLTAGTLRDVSSGRTGTIEPSSIMYDTTP